MDVFGRLDDLAGSIPDADRLAAVQQRASRLHRRRVLTASGTSAAVVALGVAGALLVLPGRGASPSPQITPLSSTVPSPTPAPTAVPVPRPDVTCPADPATGVKPVGPLPAQTAAPVPTTTEVGSPGPASGVKPTGAASPSSITVPVPRATTTAAPGTAAPVPAQTAVPCELAGAAPGGLVAGQFTG